MISQVADIVISKGTLFSKNYLENFSIIQSISVAS